MQYTRAVKTSQDQTGVYVKVERTINYQVSKPFLLHNQSLTAYMQF